MLNWPATRILRNTGTRITITVPSFPEYELPNLGNETISTQPIAASLITATTPVLLFSGTRSVTIVGRTARC